MTRLADALRRANGGFDDAAATTTTVAPPRQEFRPVAVMPRAVETVAPKPNPNQGPTPLLGLSINMEHPSAWRHDPELVGKLLGTEGFSSAATEQYRKLAATLHHVQVERGMKVIMTASALPGEGKSLTAVNLSLTLSESYHRRVLLIDADLRRPTVQRIFGLPAVAGLNEGLKSGEDRPMPIVPISERLFVLPAGRPEADPMSGLTSDRMRRLIAQASSAFDWVIVDTPPVGLLPDASLLAAIVDGVLLVIRSGQAPFALVKRTVDAISHDRILGVVMNAIEYVHDKNAAGYHDYYGGGYYGTPAK
jgi:protein-tyrosine kinase